VDRLIIHGAQRLELPLWDIADLLAVCHTGVCPREPAEQLLHPLAELDAEIARLAASHDRGGRPSGAT
jgi:hypothetical protein